MTSDIDSGRVPSIFCYVLEYVCDGFGGIIDICRAFSFRIKPVVDVRYGKPLLPEFSHEGFRASFEPSSVKPDQCGEAFSVFRIIQVKLAPFEFVWVCFIL